MLNWIATSKSKFAEFIRQTGEEYREEIKNENKE